MSSATNPHINFLLKFPIGVIDMLRQELEVQNANAFLIFNQKTVELLRKMATNLHVNTIISDSDCNHSQADEMRNRKQELKDFLMELHAKIKKRT